MRGRRSTLAKCGLATLALLNACTEVKDHRNPAMSPETAADGPETSDSTPASDSAAVGGNGGGQAIGQVKAAGRSAAGSGGAGAAAPSGGTGVPAATGGMNSPSAGAGGGTSPAATAGAGVPVAPMAGEVAGKIIDFWRQPMPSVQVTIGSTTVMTDAQGGFRIPDVPASYDATFVINTTQNGDPMRFVWRYEGLTRRNPTLQGYTGNPPHGAWLDLNISGVDFMRRQAGDMLLISYGGVVGEWTPNPPSAAQEQLRLVWEGPISTHFTGHAFRMLKLENRIEPSQYYAYDSFSFDVTADRNVQVSYELPNDKMLPSRELIGTLDGAPGADRNISVYMRFPDNATIPLMYDPAASPTFSYGIPSMPADATITLVAGQDGEGFQRMHVDGIDRNTDNVALTLPAGVRLVAPPADAVVDANTMFLWEAEPNVYVFSAQDEVGRDLVHVVTTKREARLPQAPTFVYQPHRFSWIVEMHGKHPSVDEATGPEGFLDTVALSNMPRGPARGRGTYVESTTLWMSIKP